MLAVAMAVITTVGSFGASHNQPDLRAIDGLAIALLVAGPLSLIAAARFPVAVMWFVAALASVYVILDYPYGPFFATVVVAGALTVVLGHRLHAWLAFAMVFVAQFAIRQPLHDRGWSWPMFLGVLAWALLVLMVWEIVKVRRDRRMASRRARVEAEMRRSNEERLRIARELHDVVAHHMSLINVQAGVALHLDDPTQTRTALETIKSSSHEALTELRSLVTVLRQPGEDAPRMPAGRLSSLDDLVDRTAQAGLDVRRRTDGRPFALPESVELAAVRVVQEAITNVVRHADAEHADVVLAYRPGRFEVTVEDDGRGLADQRGSGSGLVGMRERVEALGGTLRVTSDKTAKGVRVHATFPLEEDR